MNIFFLSSNPKEAAKWHCDKHVVKMILESTQLLWTAWHLLSPTAPPEDAPCTLAGQRGYKPTHRNHPCAIWVRESQGNYEWLCALAAALVEEYHYRYTSTVIHACEAHITWLTANPPAHLPPGPRTWPAVAMPEEYKAVSRSPIQCYRAFYVGSKGARGLLVYTRRPKPRWMLAGVVPTPKSADTSLP